MTDTPFNAKNGLIANGTFTANSSVVNLGSNLSINTSTIFLGNSTTNSTLTSNTFTINYSNGGYLFINYDQIATTGAPLYIQNFSAASGLFLFSNNSNTNILGNAIVSGGLNVSGNVFSNSAVTVNNSVYVSGINSSLFVYDRNGNTSSISAFYMSNNITRLWNGVVGDVLTYNSNGVVFVANLVANVSSGSINGTIIGANTAANGTFSSIKAFSNSGGLGGWGAGSIRSGGLTDVGANSGAIGFFFAANNTGYIQTVSPGVAFLPLVVQGSNIRLQGSTNSNGINIDAYGNVTLEANTTSYGVATFAANAGFYAFTTITRILINGNYSINQQGSYIHWNRTDAPLGGTSIINQKGLGSGGIQLGESDSNNNVTVSALFTPTNTNIMGFLTVNNASVTSSLQTSNTNVTGSLTANNSTLNNATVNNASVTSSLQIPTVANTDNSSNALNTAALRNILTTLASSTNSTSGSVQIPGSPFILKYTNGSASAGTYTWNFATPFPNACVYADGIGVSVTSGTVNCFLNNAPTNQTALFNTRFINTSGAVSNFNQVFFFFAIGY